jgi:hypothetical protein
MWATIARSVADGPLKQAGVDLAKVASSPMYKNEGESVRAVGQSQGNTAESSRPTLSAHT